MSERKNYTLLLVKVSDKVSAMYFVWKILNYLSLMCFSYYSIIAE